MIIVYAIKNKIYSEEEFPEEPDPLTNEKGIELVVTQKYFWCFGPYTPLSRKIVTAYSMNNYQPIPLVIWTESMKVRADLELTRAKGMWKLFMVPIIILPIFALIYVYGKINIKNRVKKEEVFHQRIAEPAVGDVVYSKTRFLKNKIGGPLAPKLFVGKITKVDKDTIFMRNSHQKVDMKNTYDFEKVFDRLKISDEDFDQEQTKYIKSDYINGRTLIPFIEAKNEELEFPNLEYIAR